MADKIQLSDLRCLITVKGRVLTPDVIGGNSAEWVTRGRTLACIEDISKSESFRAARTEALVGQRVIIRKGSFPVRAGVEGQAATAGRLVMTFVSPLTEETATDLPNDDTTFTWVLSVDGTPVEVEIVGEENQTFAEFIATVDDQAGVSGSIDDDGALVFTSPTTGGNSNVNLIGNDDLLFDGVGLQRETVNSSNGQDAVEGVTASPGLTVDDVVQYDGRNLPIKTINNIREGRVEYVELICVQGDPTGPGV